MIRIVKAVRKTKETQINMKSLDYSTVTLTDGFFKERRDLIARVSIDAIYDRFEETHRFEALECKWREGDPHVPHIYWDSDVAKWVESASYFLTEKTEPRWVERIESIIDLFIKNQDEQGYFNSHFLVTEQDKRFKNRIDHELYCAGHWIEAAVAYYEATGKTRFLDAVSHFADYIERAFKTEHSAAFFTPGHPELELALVRLYRATGERRYFDLAKYFIDEHGVHPEDRMWQRDRGWSEDYNQDLTTLRERTSIDGHCVRALYLLSGMIDVAATTEDSELADACKRIFDNCAEKKMYVTGGVGSTRHGEAFTVDYHLPNRTSYTESCAAISLAMAANRMLKIDENAKYADVVERVLYNSGLSGISLDGKSFFYENPLEIDLDFNHPNVMEPRSDHYPKPTRSEIFVCSCCPPNISRFIASVSGFAIAESDTTVFVNQFMSVDSPLVTVKTDFPTSGKITVTAKDKSRRLAIRIPAWAKSFTLNKSYEIRNGYAFINETVGDTELVLDMSPRLVASNRRAHDNAGRVAVMRGPVVYCAEGIDNGSDLASVLLKKDTSFRLEQEDLPLPVIFADAKRPSESNVLYSDLDEVKYDALTLRLIPYFAFANRGESDMIVWLLCEK